MEAQESVTSILEDTLLGAYVVYCTCHDYAVAVTKRMQLRREVLQQGLSLRRTAEVLQPKSKQAWLFAFFMFTLFSVFRLALVCSLILTSI